MGSGRFSLIETRLFGHIIGKMLLNGRYRERAIGIATAGIFIVIVE